MFRRANWLRHGWTACLLESRDLAPTHGSRIGLMLADSCGSVSLQFIRSISRDPQNPRPMCWGMSATVQLVRHALRLKA